MEMIPQLLAGSLSHGAIYALAAMGFVRLWQASQTINFAQGEFVMLAAFAFVLFLQVLGLPRHRMSAMGGVFVRSILAGLRPSQPTILRWTDAFFPGPR